MGPFGLPWPIVIIYLLSTIGMLLFSEVIIRSKKWRKKAEMYFHWNDPDTTNED